MGENKKYYVVFRNNKPIQGIVGIHTWGVFCSKKDFSRLNESSQAPCISRESAIVIQGFSSKEEAYELCKTENRKLERCHDEKKK